VADATRWRVFETGTERFPYRIAIVQGGRETLVLRTQARWPGPGAQVFCLRETEAPADLPEPLEDVAIANVKRFGRKLSLVLARSRRKRCDFLFLERPYKNRPGEYEQIFFRTQQSLRQHKSRGRTTCSANRPSRSSSMPTSATPGNSPTPKSGARRCRSATMP
jgi:hypothetical protein